MKFFRYLIPVLFLFLAAVSCGEEKAPTHFQLEIKTNIDLIEVRYVLSDSGLAIYESADPQFSTRTLKNRFFPVSEKDSLLLISKLDIKSHDCQEQHALDVNSVTFTTDSATVNVDPNVNHPKELDYAVRLINSLVPAELRLDFIDMQPAIEPDGKLRL